MARCVYAIAGGSTIDCEALNAQIGVDRDLILVDYAEFNRAATLATIEADDTNGNIGGLTNINLLAGATQHIFEGMDYSVIPTVTPEVKEDGTVWYDHSILFTVYSKTAEARAVIESLGGARVVAICGERSTGLYEIFGVDQGLSLSAVERSYVGSQTSNFYNVTIETPKIGIVKEKTLAQLAVNIIVGV
jgi:hypothetical protein